MGGSIQGVHAAVKWHYASAATLHGYTLTRQDRDWHVRATVVRSNAYNLAQRPLVFVARHDHGAWYWPIVDFEIRGVILAATLGPPIEAGSYGSVRSA